MSYSVLDEIILLHRSSFDGKSNLEVLFFWLLFYLLHHKNLNK